MFNSLRELTKWAALGLAALILLAVVFDFSQAWLARVRVARLLQLAQQTQVGVETETQFRESAKRILHFTGIHEHISADPFDPTVSEISYEVFTAPVSVHFLPPAVMFNLETRVRNGRIINKSAVFYSEGDLSLHSEAGVEIRTSPYGPDSGPAAADYPHHFNRFELSENWADGRWRRLWVEDDNESPAAVLKSDWDFNLGCITKLGGCQDAREILPAANLRSPNTKYD